MNGERNPLTRKKSASAALAALAATTLIAMLSNHGVMQGQGGIVKVTPLGSHAGELCARDRAFLFEDPTGVRILYDPGFMVDESDPRLGEVHLLLLSHAHNDHIGSRRDRGGSCAAPAMGPANNSSNIVTIAATKNAALMTANEAAAFFAVKIQEIRGAAVPQCATAGINDETTVPVAAPCIAPIGVSGTRTIKRGGTSTAVQIIGVQALHPNNIPGAMINAPALASGTSAYAGLALGYIVRFTNGLTAYLTGDTGMFNDMGEVIGKLYRPNLVVMNIGPGGNGPTSLGHEDAATIIRNMLRPTTVMPTHVGEQATSGGALVANTRTEAFARSTRSYSAVVLPLSDVTLSFDRDGNCVGCGR